MPLDDRIEVVPELEDQIASQAENNGRVAIRDTSINDLQVGRELKPTCDRDVVEQLSTGSIIGIEEGAEL